MVNTRFIMYRPKHIVEKCNSESSISKTMFAAAAITMAQMAYLTMKPAVQNKKRKISPLCMITVTVI